MSPLGAQPPRVRVKSNIESQISALWNPVQYHNRCTPAGNCSSGKQRFPIIVRLDDAGFSGGSKGILVIVLMHFEPSKAAAAVSRVRANSAPPTLPNGLCRVGSRFVEQPSIVRRQSDLLSLRVDRCILVAAVLVGRREAKKRVGDVVCEGRLLLVDGAVKPGKPVHIRLCHDVEPRQPSRCECACRSSRTGQGRRCVPLRRTAEAPPTAPSSARLRTHS
jgi:hypothetical protein